MAIRYRARKALALAKSAYAHRLSQIVPGTTLG
ncbi:hypothetical protein XBLMG947_0420 [Xanthomonas bromi]|uniref:Uncharacterized protein n=1 Tax=Xanthomonas bromi TaxID=56449 RepID=A0A1C3NH10_9XANT|nr:hypothetical protein XBLMG947_0420 [Xanthomonas bromi]